MTATRKDRLSCLRGLPVLAFSLSLAAATGGLAQYPDEPEGLCAHALRAATLREGGPPSGGPQRDFVTDTDVLHYDLDIVIEPVSQWIGGSNRMTVRSLVDDLTLFRFRLRESFNITEMTVNGVLVSWTQIDVPTVEVQLDRAYHAGEVFELYVEYDGYPVEGLGFGSIEFRTRSGAREVWTLSEPWFAYTWWPCKDENTDKATATLTFTVPVGMIVASNGLLTAVEPVGLNQTRFRWETNYLTAPYLFCFGATNYDTFGATWTYADVSMPLAFYIYPENNTAGNRAAWLKNLDMLTAYSDLYGIYPFHAEKYGMCQVGFGGGMEHQTMTSQGGFWESVTAHELAHQWWGDNVTCATWHDIWLNEGFATYSEALWYENRPGGNPEDLHAHMANRRPSSVDGTVYVYDISSVSRIFSNNFSYRKAGWLLHMLRHVLGDDTFFDVLAAYRAAFEDGAATSEDFIGVAEAVAGRDLMWFFGPWLYDVGAPAYAWGTRTVQIGAQTYLEVFVRQEQPSSFPLFTMPLDVVVTMFGGPQGDGPVTFVFWNDAQQEHLLFPLPPGGITAIELDPAPWVLWTSRALTAFIEGPPKIVTMSPAAGSAQPPSAVEHLLIGFHKHVVCAAPDFTLEGQASGPVAFDFVYDPVSFVATLTPTGTLTPDQYTLTVADTIVDFVAGLSLDGELGPDGLLPSGEGLPGGAAVATFDVIVPTGDMNCDGSVDFDDIDGFILALTSEADYAAAYPDCNWLNGDCDGDGDVDFDDIDPFVVLLGG